MTIYTAKNEIWKTIPDFEGYQVSNLGRIKSLERTVLYKDGRLAHFKEKILKLQQTWDGYQVATLSKDCISYKRRVNRLVLETFIGSPPDGNICRHFPDPNKLNNTLENLSWGTYQENEADKAIHGRNYKFTNAHRLALRNGQKVRRERERTLI